MNRNMELKKIARIVIPILIALLSFFGMARYASSPEFYDGTIASLDEKKTTVMELTAASTAASAAITLIPGDTATPIAEKLADLSSWFLLALIAVYLEKYLLTITGFAAFRLLIPAACALFLAHVFSGKPVFSYLAKKFAVFGIAIVLVVPASVKISDMIEATYESSIEETIASARETSEEIEEGAEEDENFLSSLWSKVEEGVSGAVTKVENLINRFLEALAVMLVTSCVIPLVVLFFFAWLIKAVIGVDLNLSGRFPRRGV